MLKVFGTKTDSRCIKIGQNTFLFSHNFLTANILSFWHKNSVVFKVHLMP